MKVQKALRKSAARQRAWRFGRMAEFVCRARLRLCGWRILARNFRAPVGEIDIVARRGGLIAFIEVKARTGVSLEVSGPTPHQRRRIERAAQMFLARHPALAACSARFDVMRARPLPHPRSIWPEHLTDAWHPESD